MSVHYQDDRLTLLHGDATAMVSTLPDSSVQAVVTSPPYFGLRDYGEPEQYGAEATVAEFVERLVLLFAEVRRVLTEEGTVWLNLGDTYSPTRGLQGIPWQVAAGLTRDGWFLRSEVIWNKPKVMPESIKNRPTRSHEHIFMLTRINSGYLYNHEEVREDAKPESAARYDAGFGGAKAVALREAGIRIAVEGERDFDGKRAMRDVWTESPVSFPGAHFATYPPSIPRRCIRASSRPGDTVLDPFSGSGTTGMVALQEGRKYVGIDLNADYLDLSLRERFQEQPLDMYGSVA